MDDAQRQAFIEPLGIRVLRFTNPQVYDKLDAVVEEIWRVVGERVLQRENDPPRSPLDKGGGV